MAFRADITMENFANLDPDYIHALLETRPTIVNAINLQFIKTHCIKNSIPFIAPMQCREFPKMLKGIYYFYLALKTKKILNTKKFNDADTAVLQETYNNYLQLSVEQQNYLANYQQIIDNITKVIQNTPVEKALDKLEELLSEDNFKINDVGHLHSLFKALAYYHFFELVIDNLNKQSRDELKLFKSNYGKNANSVLAKCAVNIEECLGLYTPLAFTNDPLINRTILSINSIKPNTKSFTEMDASNNEVTKVVTELRAKLQTNMKRAGNMLKV